MDKLKLNTVLGKTEHLSSQFKASIKDYIQFFKDKSGSFKGEKKTYEPKNGTVDIPSERGNKLVVTTVAEKLNWLKETNQEYIDLLFSQEATNASGTPKAKLTVEGVEFGEFSSLELLRLKSFLENGDLEEMYKQIPVRNDDEEWNQTTEEMYQGKAIFENKKQAGTKKSIVKESYVMIDPNVKDLKDSSSYKAPIGSKDTVMELGDYTFQKFTGELSHRERAEILRRRSKLLSATIEALKVSNEVDAVKSNMNAEKLFSYLHVGKIGK